jgi:hypothetical protein
MKLKEAIEALRAGKKVHLKGWGDKSYMKLVGDVNPEIRVYTETTNKFDYTSEILLSDDWLEVGTQEPKYSFSDILQKVLEGRAFKKSDWRDDVYIIFDRQLRDIVSKDMEQVPFHINFESMILDDWELVP